MIGSCLLTVIIEYLYMTKKADYASKDEKRLIIFTNIFTNIVMNVALAAVVFGIVSDLSVKSSTLPLLVLFGSIIAFEVVVVAVEYLIYRLAFGKLSKLFKHTIIANLLSFGIGLLAAGLIALIVWWLVNR